MMDEHTEWAERRWDALQEQVAAKFRGYGSATKKTELRHLIVNDLAHWRRRCFMLEKRLPQGGGNERSADSQ
jgi:hypothetical protein